MVRLNAALITQVFMFLWFNEAESTVRVNNSLGYKVF